MSDEDDFDPDWMLFEACENNDLEAARAAIAAGAEPDCRECDESGMTALHVAVRADNDDMVRLLLDAGASTYIEDLDEDTPLHHAAIFGSLDAARVLLEAGAIPNFRNGRGFLPLDIAIEEEYLDMANLLLEHKAESMIGSEKKLAQLEARAIAESAGDPSLLETAKESCENIAAAMESQNAKDKQNQAGRDQAQSKPSSRRI